MYKVRALLDWKFSVMFNYNRSFSTEKNKTVLFVVPWRQMTVFVFELLTFHKVGIMSFFSFSLLPNNSSSNLHIWVVPNSEYYLRVNVHAISTNVVLILIEPQNLRNAVFSQVITVHLYLAIKILNLKFGHWAVGDYELRQRRVFWQS